MRDQEENNVKLMQQYHGYSLELSSGFKFNYLGSRRDYGETVERMMNVLAVVLGYNDALLGLTGTVTSRSPRSHINIKTCSG